MYPPAKRRSYGINTVAGFAIVLPDTVELYDLLICVARDRRAGSIYTYVITGHLLVSTHRVGGRLSPC